MNGRFSPLAYFTIDSKGRRFLLLLSLILMIPLLIAAGFSLQIDRLHPNNPTRVGLFATFLTLYTAAYSPGGGVVPFLYSSEIFPLVNRGMFQSVIFSIYQLAYMANSVSIYRGRNVSELHSQLFLSRCSRLDSSPTAIFSRPDAPARTVCVRFLALFRFFFVFF